MSFAASPSQQLQWKLNAIGSMSASFKQTVTTTNGRQQISYGNMAMLRPGYFRWQVNSPFRQLIVADGKKMWFYNKELQQVTVKKQSKAITGSPAFILSGYAKRLSDYFNIKALPAKKGSQRYSLVRRGGRKDFAAIEMTFKGADIKRIVAKDRLGQILAIGFSSITRNRRMAKSLFRFKSPAGVDVINQAG